MKEWRKENLIQRIVISLYIIFPFFFFRCIRFHIVVRIRLHNAIISIERQFTSESTKIHFTVLSFSNLFKFYIFGLYFISKTLAAWKLKKKIIKIPSSFSSSRYKSLCLSFSPSSPPPLFLFPPFSFSRDLLSRRTTKLFLLLSALFRNGILYATELIPKAIRSIAIPLCALVQILFPWQCIKAGMFNTFQLDRIIKTRMVHEATGTDIVYQTGATR